MKLGKSKVGRPHCQASGEAVAHMRAHGVSWRQIARSLDLGTATATRLCNGSQNRGEVSQNSPCVKADLEAGSEGQSSTPEAA